MYGGDVLSIVAVAGRVVAAVATAVAEALVVAVAVTAAAAAAAAATAAAATAAVALAVFSMGLWVAHLRRDIPRRPISRQEIDLSREMHLRDTAASRGITVQ